MGRRIALVMLLVVACSQAHSPNIKPYWLSLYAKSSSIAWVATTIRKSGMSLKARGSCFQAQAVQAWGAAQAQVCPRTHNHVYTFFGGADALIRYANAATGTCQPCFPIGMAGARLP